MIASPSPDASRSSLADWLEVTAFLRGRPTGSGDLESLLRLNSDNDRERILTGDELMEEEIVETRRDALVSRTAEEISFRERTLGLDYPFDVLGDPLRLTCREPLNDTSHKAYLFMLLMTAFKDQLLPSSTALTSRLGQGRTLFHHCASIGVAGVIRDGHTFWFGWPRPNKAPFAAALDQLCKQLGFGRPKSPPPPGLEGSLAHGLNRSNISAVGEISTTELRRRQTNAFRPGTRPGVEHDFVFEVSTSVIKQNGAHSCRKLEHV